MSSINGTQDILVMSLTYNTQDILAIPLTSGTQDILARGWYEYHPRVTCTPPAGNNDSESQTCTLGT